LGRYLQNPGRETFLTDHDNDEAVQLGFTNGQRVATDTQRHLSNQLCAELLAPARRATVEILVDGKATILGTIVDTDGLVLIKRSEIMTHHGSLLGKLTCRLFNGEEVSAKVISEKIEPLLGNLTLAVEMKEGGVTLTSAALYLDRHDFAKLFGVTP